MFENYKMKSLQSMGALGSTFVIKNKFFTSSNLNQPIIINDDEEEKS